MKKFTYLLAVAAVFTACNSGNNGYTVTGTVEGAADGDTVYLETVEGRQFVKLDSAVIKDGTFTFKGTQDTAVNRYISYKAEGKDGAAIDFFLENGKIKINLSQENNSATGTANNDAYQEIRAQINGLNKQMMSIYESMSDTTLTDEQREAKGKEMENLENSMISAIKAGINKNITNPVGVLLLKQNYYYMDVADLDPLMPQIPAAYDNDEAIVKIKNFEIVGVSLDQSADAWKEAIKKLNITWPQMSDLKYWNCEGAQLYAVSSIPHTVLIDGEGTILARGLHGDELQEKIAEAVK